MEVPGRRVNDDRAIHLVRGEPMTSLDRRGVAAASAAYGAPHYPDADFLPVCGYRGTWTGAAIGMCINPTGVGCPACREVLNTKSSGPALVPLYDGGPLVELTAKTLGWTSEHQAALDHEMGLPWWRLLARRRARRNRPLLQETS